MPRHLPRNDVVRQIQATRGNESCIACALRDGRMHRRLVHESEHAFTMLSGYPREWGHLMVVLRRHHTRLVDVSREEWADASAQALVAGQVLERLLEPARCYIASLGTNKDGLALTFPHLHIHVLPVFDEDKRPHEVFISDGMLEASPTEWERLHESLRQHWPLS